MQPLSGERLCVFASSNRTGIRARLVVVPVLLLLAKTMECRQDLALTSIEIQQTGTFLHTHTSLSTHTEKSVIGS